MIRYNSTTNRLEAYENTSWTNVTAEGSYLPLTGGTLVGSVIMSQADTNPTFVIQNTSSTAARSPTLQLSNFTGGNGGNPQITMMSGRGNSTTPAAIATNDTLGVIAFGGYLNSTTANAGAGIQVIAEGNFSATSSPAFMSFSTTPSGSLSTTERLRITATGNIGIGTTVPGTILDVAGQSLLVRGTGTTPGELRLAPGPTTGTNYVGFKAPASNPASSLLWELPAADGTTGYILSTNGSGALSWVSNSGTASTALSGLTAAAATRTLANVNYAQVWNWDSLSTQTAMTMASTSMTTGSVLAVTNSYSNAASTGTVLKVTNSGASSTAVPLAIINNGGGLSFRVNDDGTATDSTPVIVDQIGNVGVGTTAANELLTVDGGNLLVTGTFGTSPTIATSGSGSRMMWYSRKAAFRAGNVTGPNWDDANIGTYSTSFGTDNLVTCSKGMSWGRTNTVSCTNDSATAWGFSNIASQDNSTAFGYDNTASGDTSLAFGYSSNATGPSSVAWGGYESGTIPGGVASGQSSTAWGGGTTAAGSFSTALGKYVQAGDTANTNGNYSLAIGLTNVSTAGYAKVTGNGSMGVIMQDQHNLTFSASNVMIFGNILLIILTTWISMEMSLWWRRHNVSRRRRLRGVHEAGVAFNPKPLTR